MFFPEEIINFILGYVPISCEIKEYCSPIGEYKYADLEYILQENYNDFGVLVINSNFTSPLLIYHYASGMIDIQKIYFINYLPTGSSIKNLPFTLRYENVYEMLINNVFSFDELEHLNGIIPQSLNKLRIVNFTPGISTISGILDRFKYLKSLYIRNWIFNPVDSKILPCGNNYILEKFEIDVRSLPLAFSAVATDVLLAPYFIVGVLSYLLVCMKGLKKLNLIIDKCKKDAKEWKSLFIICPTLQVIKFKKNMKVHKIFRDK